DGDLADAEAPRIRDARGEPEAALARRAVLVVAVRAVRVEVGARAGVEVALALRVLEAGALSPRRDLADEPAERREVVDLVLGPGAVVVVAIHLLGARADRRRIAAAAVAVRALHGVRHAVLELARRAVRVRPRDGDARARLREQGVARRVVPQVH